ncbi:unnamed protein product, partial [Mesorhabditis spiculigera]
MTNTARVDRKPSLVDQHDPRVDLGEVARDAALFAQIKGLLLEHKVLFFRDQNFSKLEHVELAQRFGELEDHPALGSDPDHPGLVRIYKDLDSPPEHFENAYHCDATWRVNPPMGCSCVVWKHLRSTFGARMPIDQRHQLKERFPDAEHPVVRTHPETGEKILFVNSFATPRELSHARERPLRNRLRPPAQIPEYQVRWRWTENSVAIWDNRSTQHYAVQDYWPAVRKMERAGIIGDAPF